MGTSIKMTRGIFNNTKTKSVYNATIIPNCKLWLDASFANSVSTVGSKIDAWSDMSGNNNHFTQSTQSLQFEYLLNFASGNNMCYNFQGKMEGGDILTPTDINKFTLFVVLLPDADTPTGSRFLFKRAATTYYDTYLVDLIKMRIYDGTTIRGTSNTPLSTTIPNIITYNINSSTSKIFVNRVIGASFPYTATGTGAINTDIGIGIEKIKLGAIIFYDGGLNTGEIAYVEGGLQALWRTVVV